MLRFEALGHMQMRFPWVSSKARKKLMDAIHGPGAVTDIYEAGQILRRKSKGGGFNPYGSEGPPPRGARRVLNWLAH